MKKHRQQQQRKERQKQQGQQRARKRARLNNNSSIRGGDCDLPGNLLFCRPVSLDSCSSSMNANCGGGGIIGDTSVLDPSRASASSFSYGSSFSSSKQMSMPQQQQQLRRRRRSISLDGNNNSNDFDVAEAWWENDNLGSTRMNYTRMVSQQFEDHLRHEKRRRKQQRSFLHPTPWEQAQYCRNNDNNQEQERWHRSYDKCYNGDNSKFSSGNDSYSSSSLSKQRRQATRNTPLGQRTATRYQYRDDDPTYHCEESAFGGIASAPSFSFPPPSVTVRRTVLADEDGNKGRRNYNNNTRSSSGNSTNSNSEYEEAVRFMRSVGR